MTELPPTPEQADILAACQESDESMMVEALAGTGKTTTLVKMTAVLPVMPALALAFNVKIKKELEARFPAHFTVKTMNGLGHGAWAKLLNRQPEVDERKLGKLVTQALKVAEVQGEDSWDQVRQLVTAAMNAGLVPDVFPVKTGFVADTPQMWASIAEDNYLDHDPEICAIARDVLISSIKLGFGAGGVKPVISYDDQIYLSVLFGGVFQRFQLVMVDEAQDLSPLQHEMVRKSCSGRLIVVGDPKQAIYAFRGADSESMMRLRALRESWIDLPLTRTFRCPRLIVDRQQEHAPGYNAAESNPDGEVLNLVLKEEGWTWANVPPGEIAVLCRNNAPLLSLALKLLAQHIPVVMLGRDIGKGLVALAKKILPITTMPAEEAREMVNRWLKSEESLARANDKEHKIAGLTDRAECLLAVLEHCATAGELQTKLKELFSRERGQVTLASIHRAKGLEWRTVLHLDPWRIPSKYARRAASEGRPSQLTQEFNLRYVAETRAKHTLVLANLDDFS